MQSRRIHACCSTPAGHRPNGQVFCMTRFPGGIEAEALTQELPCVLQLEADWPAGKGLQARVGVHTGEAADGLIGSPGSLHYR